jgi:hypothetical protein
MILFVSGVIAGIVICAVACVYIVLGNDNQVT